MLGQTLDTSTALAVRALMARCDAAGADTLDRSHAMIREQLARQGICFEGRSVPISLHPTVLIGAELQHVAAKAALIRGALQRLIAYFLAEHEEGHLDGPVHRFFRPYAKWWDLIANERRMTDPIQLMRYDAIREETGRWALVETNTCCPGGTIHCARIRDAWLASPLGHAVTRGVDLIRYPIDRDDSFVMHMVRVGREVSGEDAPNLAVCSYRGFYTNELASLRVEHRRLVEQGSLPGGEFLICDATEVECDGERAFVRGRPVAVIHNKVDQLLIDPTAPDLAGWIRASTSRHVEFLNSIAAMYLTEAKRALAFLHDIRWQRLLELDAATRQAIGDLIPPSHLLTPTEPGGEIDLDRSGLVLKADMLTRGAGVHIGKQLSTEEWVRALSCTARDHGIVQQCVATPTRVARQQTSGAGLVDEYYGIDLFFFGDEFAGPVSRSHTEMIFNVGNGGRESPVLVTA